MYRFVELQCGVQNVNVRANAFGIEPRK